MFGEDVMDTPADRTAKRLSAEEVRALCRAPKQDAIRVRATAMPAPADRIARRA